MFSSPLKTVAAHIPVSVLTGNPALGRRIKLELEATGRYHVELNANSIAAPDSASLRSAVAALHIIEADAENPAQLVALEKFLQSRIAPMPVIVISSGLAQSAARRFLRLQIADWLPESCSGAELVSACDQALRPAKTNGSPSQARCMAFIPALGGAGATTLSLAAAAVVAGKSERRWPGAAWWTSIFRTAASPTTSTLHPICCSPKSRTGPNASTRISSR